MRVEDLKKKGGGGMSAFDKRTRRVLAHSVGQASGALRSKRLKDGKTALRRGTAKGGRRSRKGCSEKGTSIRRVR